MRQLYTFHGGIHPAENKTVSNHAAIEPAGIPPKLILPLQQHIGQPAKPIVEVGDTVLKGQMVAEAQGPVSVAVHAPTSGTIEAICDWIVPHPSGMSDRCMVLIPDGEERWCDLAPCADYRQQTPQQLLDRIRDAGIAGMGGAGFPTEIKLHPPRDDKVATLILNGVECEPYITADDRLMRERAEEVVGGMEIMAYILEPGECVIAVEDNKPEAIKALKHAAAGTAIEVVTIPTKYPSGGEKQLVKVITGKEVPHGRIPADISVMCQNVGTAAAVYQAVVNGKPLISRITTLTGDGLTQPGNYEVLLGSPVEWLLETHGYNTRKTHRLLMGGPMMGFTLHATEVPVIKTTNCLLAATVDELPMPQPAQACIRCGECARVCPAELLPQQLYWFARSQEYDKAEHHNLFDCIECGACSFVCPSSIPLVQYYRHAKGSIRQQQADQIKSDRSRERFEFRQARLEREKAEKEAKRKARAAAAAKAQAAKKAAAKEAGENAGGSADTAPMDAKKAAVAAALERSQAKKQTLEKTALAETEAKATTPDLDTLQKNLDVATNKLAKMEDALENARQNNPDQVEKLTRAVDKNRNRVEQAQAELDKARQAEKPETTPAADKAPSEPEVSIETLQKNLDVATNKLAKMEDALENARQNNPDQVEKLTRAVEKNRNRVEQARQALEAATATS